MDDHQTSNYAKKTGSKRPIEVFTTEEVNILINTAETVRIDFGKIYELCLLLGLRLSEAVRLQFSDVDFEGRVITVPASASKTYCARIVPIGERCLQLLCYMREHYERPVPYGDLVIQRNFVEVRRQTGIRGSFHTLRRTSFSWYSQNPSLSALHCRSVFGADRSFAQGILEDWSKDSSAHDRLRAAQDKLASLIRHESSI